jgi:hypothetical protein
MDIQKSFSSFKQSVMQRRETRQMGRTGKMVPDQSNCGAGMQVHAETLAAIGTARG